MNVFNGIVFNCLFVCLFVCLLLSYFSFSICSVPAWCKIILWTETGGEAQVQFMVSFIPSDSDQSPISMKVEAFLYRLKRIHGIVAYRDWC